MMLKRDPAQRPTIHQLLKVKCIEDRIGKYLSHDVFKDEFSHTLLHNQNVFEEFKKIQAAKKEAEDKKLKEMEEQERLKALEDQRAKEVADAAAKLNLYQPPQSYMDKFNSDPNFFDFAHQKYLADLQKESSYDEVAT